MELRWVIQFNGALAQGPVLHPHNHEAQDRVCPLGLMPIICGHAGNLWTITVWVQDMQIAAVHLSGAGRPLRVVSCMVHTAAASGPKQP